MALTISDLAEAKKIPEHFLRALGLHDSDGSVAIPYYDEAGSLIFERKRISLAGPKRFLQPKGIALAPYGLDRIEGARQSGERLILVEGESDSWTLWLAGFYVLGLPGSGTARTLQRDHLRGFAEIYALREPGSSGASFIKGIVARLVEIGFVGNAFSIELAAFKDPSELHCDDPPRFRERFEKALNHPTVLNLARAEHIAGEEACTIPLSDIEPEEVAWLWDQRIAIGKLNIVAGDPGLGKSFLTLDIAARVSTGADFADGARCIPGSVILVTAEDGIADTIRPRLDAQGADVRRIHQLTIRAGESDRQFSLESHLELLRKKLDELGDVRLVIFDPLTAYLGDTDPNKDARVRTLLTPLAALAEETCVAILGIMHLNKAAVLDIIYRVTGSVAFVAQARTAWVVIPDPNASSRRLS